MAGLLDFLFSGNQGGGGLLGNLSNGSANVPDIFGGNQGMMLAGLGLASGATPGEGFKNMMPALQQAFEQQQAQRAGMALLNTLPGGQQKAQQPSSAPSTIIPQPQAANGSSYGNAIAGIESKGQANPYAAIGPDTGKGKAYGKYQVMDFNIPSWTKETLGQEMTPQQFLASPDAQEAVFKSKFGQYVQQTGNPQDAASMWFTGKPLAQGANASDVNGMTGQRYVDQFTQNLGQRPISVSQAANAPQPTAPTMSPPPGSPMATQPGSGLTLVDSPALQGMPDSVRKAIPLMLQSRTMAPQAMTLIQKYINPDQWQMWRDSMGNVFTRNSATGESKPLLTPTPDMMNANASGLRSPLEYDYQKNLGASSAKNTELTTEQKNAGTANPITQFESDKANAVELGKNFAKKYEGAVEGGVIAASTLPKVDMALGIVKNDPNFYSGIGENYNLAVKKIAAALGMPDTGVGQQLVAKTVADQTVNAIRTFAANSPVGRVLQKEVEAITTSLGSTANTKEALIPLLSIQRNVLRAMADTADLAQSHNGGSGKLDPAYDRAVTDYLRKNPIIDAGLMDQIRAATKQPGAQQQPQTANPYEAEMRRRKLLQ